MRIQVLLNEEAVAPRAVTFEQLTPRQIHLLKKIHAGRIDFETMEFEDLDEVNELLHYGLVDDDYQPTERGLKALAIAKVKGDQELDAVRQKQQAKSSFDNREMPASDEPWHSGVASGKNLAPNASREIEDEFDFDLDVPVDDEEMPDDLTLDDYT